MGTFSVDCAVANHAQRQLRAEVKGALVDSGSENTWISGETLHGLGVAPEKTYTYMMANGQTLTREVGFAIIHVAGRFTTDEVVFAKPGDLELIGARTLEGLSLIVDPRRKRLIAAGPRLAASLGKDREVAAEVA